VLASCATLPTARLAESPWASLPPDADLYLYADVREARALLDPLAAAFVGTKREGGGKAGRAAALLDRCEEGYAALYLPSQPGAQPGAELAVTGRWSADMLSARLGWSCGWVRHAPATGMDYWSGRRGTLEVGSPARGLLLAAAGRPGALERMAARRLSPQAGPVERARGEEPRVEPLLAGAALYAFAPLGRIGPAGATAVGGLPVRALWLTARRGQDRYELGALAALEGSPGRSPPSATDGAAAPNARALTGLVRLAAASLLRKAGIPEVAARLRAMEVEVDGGLLGLRGLSLSEAELLALLRGYLAPAAVEGSGARRGD
jgi:hypothetical protein